MGSLTLRDRFAYETLYAVSRLVYLVRHGQSEWNALRLTQGQTVHPRLTDLGREQAAAAARLLRADVRERGVQVGGLLTSDLVRAAETADIVGSLLEVVPVHDPRLRESHLGRLEGCSYDETFAAAEEFDWSDPTVPIAGGESVMDVYHRMGSVLAELDSGSVTVVVSHGDAIRAALAHVRGIRPHEADWTPIANGAVARIDDEITWLGQ